MSDTPQFNCREVYDASNGELTKAMYKELETRGTIGFIAMNLFRAHKTSFRAKKYRGGNSNGKYKDQSYAVKDWSLKQLCICLVTNQKELKERYGITFGWLKDEKLKQNNWLLYVDIPSGQVSFHSTTRYGGPDYQGQWDSQRRSYVRIIQFCQDVIERKIQ